MNPIDTAKIYGILPDRREISLKTPATPEKARTPKDSVTISSEAKELLIKNTDTTKVAEKTKESPENQSK